MNDENSPVTRFYRALRVFIPFWMIMLYMLVRLIG